MDCHMPYLSFDKNKDGDVVANLRPPIDRGLPALLESHGITKKRFQSLGGACLGVHV